MLKINLEDFGAIPNRDVDSGRAINLAFSALRAASLPDDETGRYPVRLVGSPGVYLSSIPINACNIRGYGWSVDFHGAQIISTAAGKVAFDMLHSRFGTINNLVLRSDESAKPKLGVQVGCKVSGVASGNNVFNSCYMVGHFTQAAYYNGGSEQTVENNCTFRNLDSSSSAYAAIFDSANAWKRTSDYVTGDLVAVGITGITQANPAVVTAPGNTFTNGDKVRPDNAGGMTEVNGNYYTVGNVSGDTFELVGVDSTAFGAYTSGGDIAKVQSQSFALAQHTNCQFQRPNGGPGIWQGWHSDAHSYRSSYCSVQSGNIGMDLIFDTVNSGGQYHQHFYCDMRFEGTGMEDSIRFNRITDGSPVISNFTFMDTLIFPTTQIFGSTPNSGSIRINGMDIRIGGYQGVTPDVFNDVDKFANSNGIIKTNRTLTGITGLPTGFTGELIANNGIRLYGRPRLIGSINTQTSHTGNTAETILGTITVPANSIGANGYIEIDAHWSFSGTNTKTGRVRFNGIGGTIYNTAISTTHVSGHTVAIIYNRNATNAQVSAGTATQYGVSSAAVTTSSVDTTADVDIVFTGQLTNTGETISLGAASVTVVYKE